MNKSKISILIAGATGKLGSRVTKYCLAKQNLAVNILIRNPDKNKELCESVTHAGGNVIKADLKDPESLKDVTKGIHTLISTVDGEDTLPGQLLLLEDGIKNGLKRFVPSDYTLNYKNYKIGDSFVYDIPLKFREKLEQTNVKGLHVFPGIITEVLFDWIYKPGIHVYLNPNKKLEITSYDDVARFVAAAVSNEERVGDLMIAGDILSPLEIAEVFEKATGKKFVEKFLPYEDLQNRREEEIKNGNQFIAELLGFPAATYDKKISLPFTQNDEFPEVEVVHLYDWLKSKFSKN